MKLTLNALNESRFRSQRPAPPPHTERSQVPVAVYFGNVPRGPIGKLKRALFECLQRWAVLSISLIGAEVTEILCNKGLVERLVATMRIFRYSHLPIYDPTITISETVSDEEKLSYKPA